MVIDTYDDSKNGAVISTKRFVKLLRADHDVSVITTGERDEGKVILPSFYPPGFRKVMKSMRTPLAIPSPWILRRAIRDRDVIHIQFPFFLGINAINIARKLHVPVVSTFHIQAEHLAMNAGIHSRNFITYCYKFWIKYIYNRSDMVICPSSFAEDELRSYGLKSPTMVMSNGILPMFRPVPVERSLILADKFIILSIGRLAPEKRQELIIRAINLSKFRDKIQLFLIGEGPCRDKLEHLGKTLPNPPVFMSMSQEELINYYNIADLYVHSATVEVECMTVLEAMGCGLPVLIANCKKSATKQFALDGRSLFEADKVWDLVEKIDHLIQNPNELLKLKEEYHKRAEIYRIQNSLDKLTGLYIHLKETNPFRRKPL